MIRRSILVLILALVLSIIIRYSMHELGLADYIVASVGFLIFHDVFPSDDHVQRELFKKRFPPASSLLHNAVIQDFEIKDGVMIRSYSTGIMSFSNKRPILVWIHGGGFVLGNIAADNEICSKLAHATGALVLSIEYRLAPMHRFPIPPDDVLESFIWISKNADNLGGDIDRLAIAGESAGGNLAASLVAMNIHGNATNILPKYLFLIYPVIEQGSIRPSNFIYRNTNGILTKSQMDWFWALYLKDIHDRNDYRASVLLTPPSVLKQFPPTTLFLAKHDVLLDEGIAFGEVLKEHSIPSVMIVYNSSIHGFFGRFGHGQAALEGLATTFKLHV